MNYLKNNLAYQNMNVAAEAKFSLQCEATICMTKPYVIVALPGLIFSYGVGTCFVLFHPSFLTVKDLSATGNRTRVGYFSEIYF